MISYEGLCPDCRQIECDEACMKATSNVELLPLPKRLYALLEYEARARVRDYVRANVAHATSAKDAKIEALRAEVAALKSASEATNSACIRWADDAVAQEDRAMIAEARAERLAEELLETREDAERYRCLRAQNVIAVTSHDQSVEYQRDDLDAEVDRIRRDQ